jgi:hypothetical protein
MIDIYQEQMEDSHSTVYVFFLFFFFSPNPFLFLKIVLL